MTSRSVALFLASLVSIASGHGPALQSGQQATATDAPRLVEHRLGDGPLHKLRIPADDVRTLADLRARGALVRSYDYGGFTLAVIDEEPLGGHAALAASALDVRDEYDLVPFNGLVIDGRRPERILTEIDPGERFTRPGDEHLFAGAGLYVVQFEAPVRDAWMEELTALGVVPVQPVPMNAWVVEAGPAQAIALEDLARRADHVQFVGVYEPAYRMQPVLRDAVRAGVDELFPLTVQLLAGGDVRAAVAELAGVADEIEAVRVSGPYINVDVRLHPVFFCTLAAHPRVFGLELRGVRERQDEAQGQIVAGNVTGGAPSAPGYLAWLASQGFTSSQFGGFAVNVVDDATSLTGHPDLASGRIAFAQNPTGQTGTQGGHGFLNANIVAGLNGGSGSAVEDANGYNYGLGIAPWARVGSTAIFGAGASSPTSWESSAYANGARISSNSWSFVTQFGGPIPDYDSNSQEYDRLTRDAQSGVGGNQQLLVLFAAGNNGSGSNTVSTPSTAKNIITVGASENWRQTGTDGCGITNTGANDWRDLISFSSRGPVNSAGGDGRWKPEIAAPGTHIQAGVPQSNYNGSSVCNQFFPAGQTLYGMSSGTSHSTPAVAGGAALVYQDFLNNGLGAPSPAMIKAVLANSATYMTGVGANDTLPSNGQGMGSMDLGRAFDSAARVLVDQTQVLGATGQSHVVTGSVGDAGLPFRVTLVWTDAPGATTGAPWVNDLDLTVSVGGQTYRGNVFTGASSVPGGTADFRNNTESVFLPAGTVGAFTVTVSAATIAGDGVPGNGDTTDQDFALVVYNGSSGPPPFTANFSGTPTSGVAPLTVAFTDLSSSSATSWSWTFGDGGTSTLRNPSHTYSAPGSYTVALTASGPGESDSLTRTNYVNVTPPPTPGIDDGSFEFQTAGAPPAAPWTIDFGVGHVIHPATGATSDNGLPTDGSQWAELDATSTNGSTPPSNPGGVTAPPSGGAGISQEFSYASGQSELSFDAAFTRNEGPNSSFNDWMSVDVSDGTTTINLYYADTFTPTPNTSTVNGLPMTAVSHVIVDLAVLFPSSTTATAFTVTAQVGNAIDGIQPSIGFVDDFRLGGAVPAPPVAGFTGAPTSGFAPLGVTFTDASTGSISSWAWTFGDGGTSSVASPSHAYTTPGIYSVSLSVTGAGGSDTLTRTNYITVNDPTPVAGFTGTPTSGTVPLNVAFTDASSGPITSRSWSFGDGGVSTLTNPNHTYNASGTYTVSLTVNGPGGSDTLTRTSYISVADPAPVASFTGTPTSGTVPLAVSFTDASTGPITSWAWTFGDGGTSSVASPSHTYTLSGIYTVSLTVTGPGGLDTQTRTNYITVNDIVPAPVADFSGAPLSGVAPLAVSFTDASTGSISSWAWTFGDGGTSSAASPSHTYTTPGTYDVSLTVTGPGGSDTLTRLAYVSVAEPPPVAGFTGTPTSGIVPFAVSFSDASSGSITSWAWTFGDGGTSSAVDPSHTYTVAGSYTVSLTVSGPGGSDTLTRTSYITASDPVPPPVAGFSGTPLSGTAPLDVAFTDASTGSITSWAWTFGDGGTSSAASPSHTYAVAGTYTVALTVSGPGGADTLTRTDYVTVDPPVGGTPVYYISFATNATVPGVGTVADEDVVTYDPASGTWALYFDGSDVGIGAADIAGLHVRADGSILMTFNASTTTVPGLTGGPNGTSVDDSDVVLFTFSGAPGPATAGSFSFYFDGSDVGLTTNGEDIDGLCEFANGDLGISLVGNGSMNGASANDEDVLRVSLTSTGSVTAGSATLYWDGSDVGFTSSSDDTESVTFDANGDLLISVRGLNTATGADNEDVILFQGSFGPNTSGSSSLLLDLSALGIDPTEEIDGLSVR